MSVDKKRIEWVDIFKALMVFFVAFGHTAYDFEPAGAICNMYVLSFHVSGFFFVSGYLFSRRNISFWEFLKKKIKTLMIPYYIFAVISVVIYVALGALIYSNLDVEHKSMDLLENLFGIFYANGLTGYMKWNLSLWFIPCLFITTIIFFFVVKLVKLIEAKTNFHIAVWGVMVGLVVLAYLNYYVFQLKYLPFGLEVSFYMLPVMLLGFWVRQAVNIDNISKRILFCVSIVLIIIGGAITLITQNYVSVVSSWLGNNLLVFYGSMLFSVFGYMFLSHTIVSKILSYMGRNTMAILLMHKFPIMVFQLIFEEKMANSGFYNVGLSLIITTLACVLSLGCGEILSRIAPFTIGKEKRKK